MLCGCCYLLIPCSSRCGQGEEGSMEVCSGEFVQLSFIRDVSAGGTCGNWLKVMFAASWTSSEVALI